MPPSGATLLLRLYGPGATLAAPLVRRLTRSKLIAHRIDPARFPERAGIATQARAPGPLIWFHAASVGESLSVLRLIEHLGTAHPGHSFLITSGTATSARIMAGRLPPRCQHQFAPLDSARYMTRFLDHWRPDAAVFVESELWPNMVRCTARRGIPMALVNARLSDGSARNWKRAARTAHHLLDHFTLIHCQDQRTVDHLADLGITQARAGQNLKSFSGALPHDDDLLQAMQTALGDRRVWLAASTHPGEDEIVLNAHQRLLSRHPDVLLILVPRHPERAATLAAQIAQQGLSGTRRSKGGQPEGSTQVYLADTLGEMGLWYTLCPVTCLCGSFVPVGGHNPYEPAFAGSALIHGPHYANFDPTYAALRASGSSMQVTDAEALCDCLEEFLTAPEKLLAARAAARRFAQSQQTAIDDIARDLSKALALR